VLPRRLGQQHPGEPGHTFTAENPLVTAENWDWELELGRRIDHILVRCSAHGPTLDVRACEHIFDEPVGGVWSSDHFAFYVLRSALPASNHKLQYFHPIDNCWYLSYTCNVLLT
jgi:hypothetical protein